MHQKIVAGHWSMNKLDTLDFGRKATKRQKPLLVQTVNCETVKTGERLELDAKHIIVSDCSTVFISLSLNTLRLRLMKLTYSSSTDAKCSAAFTRESAIGTRRGSN